MSRARRLQGRLRTLRALQDAIGALRSLSAQQFRSARAALGAARRYRDEVERFLGVLEPAPAGHAGPPGIVLVTSDLGLVGDYTSQLVREAQALRAEAGPGPLLCLGRRAAGPLAQAGVEPLSVEPAPASTRALTRLLLPLVETLLALVERGELGALWLVAARFEGAGSYTPVRVPVLPLAPRPGQAPLAASPYAGAPHLRAVVIREHLYATLWETLLEAMASEHGRRLVTAESARSWLEERTRATRRAVAAIRRETSTQEVLEVAAGARAAGAPRSAR